MSEPMSTVLGRMVQRTRGPLSAIEPLIPPRYAGGESALGRGRGTYAAGLVNEVGLGPQAGPDGVSWPAGPDGADAGTDRRIAGADRRVAGAPLAGDSGIGREVPPPGGSRAWTGPPRATRGADAAPGAAPAAVPAEPGRPAPRGVPRDPADLGTAGASLVPPMPRSGADESADPGELARADRPRPSGAELPASWVADSAHATRSPGPLRQWAGGDDREPPPPGQWPHGGAAGGDDREPGLPHPAGFRGARRLASLLAREEGARLDAYPQTLPGTATVPGTGAGPALTITIGHVEVRAAAESRPRPERARPDSPPRQPFRPQVTLAEFLGRDSPGRA
jgi:hypothetical protein